MVDPLFPLVELGSGAVALAVALSAWRHRHKPAGIPLVVIALAGTGWALGLGLQTLTTEWLASVGFRSLVYLSTDVVAIGWLYLAAEYAGREWFQRRSVRTAVLALAASTLLTTTFNPFDGFYAAGSRVAADGVFVHVYGPLYWLDILWKYGLILVGAGILVVEVADRTGVYREQSIAVLLAGVIPSIVAVVEILEIVSIRGFSLSAIGIALSGTVLLWSLFYADFLELPSIAQRTLMESMDAAVVAVDESGRVIDANARAASLFGIDADDIGAAAERVFEDAPTLREALEAGKRVGARATTDGPRSAAGPSTDGGSAADTTASDERGDARGESDDASDERGDARGESDDASDERGDSVDGSDGDGPDEPGADEAGDGGEDETAEPDGEETDDEVVTAEMRREHGGETRYYELTVSPITPVNEGVSLFRTDRPGRLGRLVVVTDVTERRRDEKRLQRANERLDRFASLVSHDLRNPLSVASGYLELARERGEEADFERVEAAHERMDRMIEDLLAMARAGATDIEAERVELAGLARAGWEMAATEGATLVVDLSATASVVGDADLLQHVFENLYRNAVDHNEPPVHVRVGPLEGNAGFYVEDDGRGIPADERAAVFEQGHTTSGDGNGLGLSIVAEVVDAHGWTIEATESIEGGARFEIETNPQPGRRA